MIEVTSREFDMLREAYNTLNRRVDAMDVSGTRGIGPLANEIVNLRGAMQSHELDHAKSAASRRFWIGIGAGFLVMLIGPLYGILIARF